MSDAIPLHNVHDRCLLLPVQNGGGGTVGVKGNSIVYVAAPIGDEDVTNKHYKDDKSHRNRCLLLHVHNRGSRWCRNIRKQIANVDTHIDERTMKEAIR